MSTTDIAMIAVVLVLAVLVAFMAMSETALTQMSKIRAYSLEEDGHRWATLLRRLVDDPTRWLTGLLFLVMLSHLVIATLVGLLAERHFGAWGVAIGTALEAVVLFIGLEAAPKTYALLKPDSSALRAAPVISMITKIPVLRSIPNLLIKVTNIVLPGKGLREGPYVTERELLAMADVALEEDVIEREERVLIHSIIEFGDTVVREVMVPRPDMVCVSATASVDDALAQVLAERYSRLPVTGDGIDDIVGVVLVKDVLRAVVAGSGSQPIGEIMRPSLYVPESKRVAELMREMQARQSHMAIVVDEYGGTAGLVTLEDVIEELVGEIVDEDDDEDALIEDGGNGSMIVAGRLSVDELFDLARVKAHDADYDTVAGMVLHEVGRIPTRGQVVEAHGLLLEVLRMQGRRVQRVRVARVDGKSIEVPDELLARAGSGKRDDDTSNGAASKADGARAARAADDQ